MVLAPSSDPLLRSFPLGSLMVVGCWLQAVAAKTTTASQTEETQQRKNKKGGKNLRKTQGKTTNGSCKQDKRQTYRLNYRHSFAFWNPARSAHSSQPPLFFRPLKSGDSFGENERQIVAKNKIKNKKPKEKNPWQKII